MYALVKANRESFLMRVFLKDIALPVQPGIQVPARQIGNELEAHFRVLREIKFRIHQRFHHPVVGSAKDVSQHKRHLPQPSLSAEKRQQVSTALILISLPSADVVVGVARIFVGTIKDERMKSELEAHGIQRLIGQLGLQPQPRQGVATGLLAFAFIVLEERNIIELEGERARGSIIQPIV